MLFTVCGPQVGPLVDTLIYCKLVKCPTFFNEPCPGPHNCLFVYQPCCQVSEIEASGSARFFVSNFLFDRSMSHHRLRSRFAPPTPFPVIKDGSPFFGISSTRHWPLTNLYPCMLYDNSIAM